MTDMQLIKILVDISGKDAKKICCTFWLRDQNVGIDLPFFISSLVGSSSWTGTAIPGIFVAPELEITPANLMKQPGFLQITTDQRDLLLPAKSKYNNNNNKYR